MFGTMKTLERRSDKRRQQKPQTAGELSEDVQKDKNIQSEEHENTRRRTIVIHKCTNSFGFELQTFAIHHKKPRHLELCTYVCKVHADGPAQLAGMLPGDIILSVDGISVESASHETIVQLIKMSSKSMRLVVIFEDCVRRVELNKKLVKLRRKLSEKKLAYRALQAQQDAIVGGTMKDEPPSRRSSFVSGDSGIVCPKWVLIRDMKSRSMDSMSSSQSSEFNLSQIPGNQSIESIALGEV